MPSAVKLNRPAIRAITHSVTGPVAADLLARGTRVMLLARQLAPTGRYKGRRGGAAALKGNIRVLRMGVQPLGVYVNVGSDLPHAIMVEEGTDPHVIRPRVKKALWWEGLAHPVPLVNHPGGRAKPYLRPALIAGR